MLAQNFKSADDLGLTEKERDALVTVLGMLERGELTHVKDFEIDEDWDDGKFTGHFSMAEWNRTADCGTVACIGGTAELVMKGLTFGNITADLNNLFYPPFDVNYFAITTEEAAAALRSYLTTGKCDWKAVIRERPAR